MSIFDQISVPTLLLDEVRCRQNIQFMVDKANRNGVRFRPHFKTHQSAEIGGWFRDAGVSAITVSSAGMAAYFQHAGWQDITIAFSANLRQAPAIDALAENCSLDLLVESPQSAAYLETNLSHPAGAWIKIDVGAHRTGIPDTRVDDVIALARQISTGKRLRFRGLLTHAGHTYHAASKAEILQIYANSVQKLSVLRSALQDSGIKDVEISYGDTPSCKLASDFKGIDEIRQGNFVFYDAMQLELGICTQDEIATALACPVVARHPDRGILVLYGGAVHLSKEFILTEGQTCYGLAALPDQTRWGPILEGARVTSLSQEHGMLQAPPQIIEQVQVGDLVVILPVHSCLTVDLMEHYQTLDGRVITTLGKGYL